MIKWWILIKERFNPWAYFPMIVVFTAVNCLYGSRFLGCQSLGANVGWILILMVFFFFRMRLFDEVKDYETDLKVNPGRPLARGLLTVAEVKTACFLLIFLELMIALLFGKVAFLIHALAIGYSLLMYKEFFIGSLLRPHLTTYAVTHTFVSSLLGLSCAVAAVSMEKLEIQWGRLWIFFLMNWCFFNLFEFARKTFALEEEREQVPSYSNTFGCFGAWLLSISQALIGAWLVYYLFKMTLPMVAAIIFVVLTIPYVIKRTAQAARFFRAASGVYLLVHYALMILLLGGLTCS